jgi:hypothetical protein
MDSDDEAPPVQINLLLLARSYNPRDDKWRTSTTGYSHMKASIDTPKAFPPSKHAKKRTTKSTKPASTPKQAAQSPPAAWNKMTVDKLRIMCGIYGLDAEGRKPQLEKRLNDFNQRSWMGYESAFQKDPNPLVLTKKNLLTEDEELSAGATLDYPNIPSPRRRGKYDETTNRHTIGKFG